LGQPEIRSRLGVHDPIGRRSPSERHQHGEVSGSDAATGLTSRSRRTRAHSSSTLPTELLAAHQSALGFVRGLLLAGLLWWAWVAYSWLGTSVRIRPGSVQLAMFVAMGAIMVLSLLMPKFFDEGSGVSLAMLAAGAYVVVRLMHLVLFYAAAARTPASRALSCALCAQC
jgi:hypothetical protein